MIMMRMDALLMLAIGVCFLILARAVRSGK